MFLYGVFQFVYKVNISFLHLLGGLFILCICIMVIIGYIAPMKSSIYSNKRKEESYINRVEIC